MNKRQKIIVSITGITLVLLILVGLTYAYFLTRIQGNTNTKSISVTTADLRLVYGDGNGYIHAEKIQPGTTLTSKTFTVTNDGNADVEYGVFLEDVVNDFKYTDDLELEITCTSNIVGNTCDGYSGKMPINNDFLISNTIEPEATGVEAEVHTYTLTLTYYETGLDQSDDMNKKLEAKVQIYDLKNTVDLSGSVTDATNGDYVEVNSEPKKSYLKNGTYKVVGLEPGNHTISVKHSDDSLSYSKTITINKGTSESISGTTATIVDDSREIVSTVSSSSMTIARIKKLKEWTLTDNDSSGGISVGDLVTSKLKSSEQFNVIGTDGGVVKILAVKNITTTGTLEQSDSAPDVNFSNTNYWSSETNYPLDLNKYTDKTDAEKTSIGVISTDAIEIARSYGSSFGVKGKLMTIEEVENVGGNINEYNTTNCPSFINSNFYWLGTSIDSSNLYLVAGPGRRIFEGVYNDVENISGTGVRPVLEIPMYSIE